MTVGPQFADPIARQLYAEIASIEEQHVTQYESIIDPDESWLEKWLLHECNEVWNYWSCVESEGDTRIKKIWQRMLDFELGPDGLLPNLLAFNIGVEIGQLLALCGILVAMSYWRRSTTFARYATAANICLLLSGVSLVVYQLQGYFALPTSS